MVEADPIYLPAYREIRPRDVVESVAVVPLRLWTKGTVTFQRMTDKGWSTISPEHAALARHLGKSDGECESITVPCLTINELLQRHFPEGNLDILSLDVEGLDREILKELDLSRFHPKIMIVENASNPMDQRGGPDFHISDYELFASTFVNSIYVRKDVFSYFRF